mgnify:CR=1 FL=1
MGKCAICSIESDNEYSRFSLRFGTAELGYVFCRSCTVDKLLTQALIVVLLKRYFPEFYQTILAEVTSAHAKN